MLYQLDLLEVIHLIHLGEKLFVFYVVYVLLSVF